MSIIILLFVIYNPSSEKTLVQTASQSTNSTNALTNATSALKNATKAIQNISSSISAAKAPPAH